MYRVGIITDKGVISKNFNTKDEAENWVLTISDKYKVKRADVVNKETKQRERIF